MAGRSRATVTRLAALLSLILIASASAARAQITVTSANPAAAEQGVTVDVEVIGDGFKRGAQARFLVSGTADPGGVSVNSTRFVGAGKLVANITVADTAWTGGFDIEVMNPDGRTGKGTERFTVLAKGAGPALCAPLPAEYGAPIGVLNPVDVTGTPLYSNPDGGPTGLGIGAATHLVTIGSREVLVAAIGSTDDRLEVFFLDPVFGTVLDGQDVDPSEDEILQVHVTVAGGSGRHIRIADFNGDGEIDIAAASQGRDGVFVTFGSRTPAGALAFSSPAVRLPSPAGIAVGQMGYSVAVGEFDGNPDTDDIVAGFMAVSWGGKAAAPARLVTYRYNGSGLEVLQVITPSGYGSRDAMGGNLSLGDLVGSDGCLDIIAGASLKASGKVTAAGEVAIFGQQRGDAGQCVGTFGATPTAILRAAAIRKDDTFGFRTTAGDADGDGDDDLVILTGWEGPDVRGDVVAGPILGDGARGIGPVCISDRANGCLLAAVRPDTGFGGGWATTGASLVDWDGVGGVDHVFVGAPNATLSSPCGSPGAAYGFPLPAAPATATPRLLFQPPSLDPSFSGFGWAVVATPGSRIVLVTDHGRDVGNSVGAGQVWIYAR